MYTVGVRDHVMIAHSFQGEIFGPAQRMHGATYVVDVEFRVQQLDTHGLVVDIGRACDALRNVLAALNYRNLDELPEFAGKNTTTEFLARAIFERLGKRAKAGELGTDAARLHSIKVTLNESHIAWASYEGALDLGA